ncbi:MAG: hypothetical protein IJ036_02315 [Lachnospiraceae bacterium]|nr:hypothetical protein [Lachnospiraceae bacterium]
MKKYITIILGMLSVLALTGCAKSMNDVIGKEPDFVGIVETVEEEYIIVNVHEDALVDGQYDRVIVPLDVELKDSMTHFSVGDEVVVYYDGNHTGTAIIELEKVYAITLRTPADSRTG